MKPHLELTIPNGSQDSNIVTLPPDAILSSLFVPTTLAGNTLYFWGDLGDGVMRQLNFVFNLTSTDPVLRGQIVPALQTQFLGLTRLQVKTDDTGVQTQDVTIIGGYLL